MKFRKKPVVIEAIKWTGENTKEIKDFVGDFVNETESKELIVIKTLEGFISASREDWIIKGVAGEFYPCKPDIFEKTYELIN